MLRKQLVVGTLALVTGMLGYSTILPAAPEATVVDSSGADCISAGSEVDSLTINDSEVRLEVNGSCSGDIDGTPKDMEDFTTKAVDEGSTNFHIDLARSATVKFPLTVTVRASTLTGKRPNVIGTTAYYDAPAPGTVPEAGGEDHFDYTFDDANGTLEKTVTIPIKWVEPVKKVPSEVCVDSATVTCKGSLPDWPGGTLFNQALARGETHVWEVVYDKEINNDGSFLVFDGGLKTISLSLQPNDFALSVPCQLTQTQLQQPISYAPVDAAAWYQCGLEDGKKYFVNIKSTLDERDPYFLTVY